MYKHRIHSVLLLLCMLICSLFFSACGKKEADPERTDMLAYCTAEGLWLCNADGSDSEEAKLIYHR